MTTSEKVAYLKGLAEGLGLGKETKEDKLFNAIIDILGAVAADLNDLEETAADLGDEIDAISDDLALVEEIVYDDECCDYDDCCCGDYDDDCCCGHDHDDDCCCGHSHDHCCCEDEPIFYEVTCPACENTITVDEDVLALGKIQCPNCGEMLEFDMESIDYDEEPVNAGADHSCGCCHE